MVIMVVEHLVQEVLTLLDLVAVLQMLDLEVQDLPTVLLLVLAAAAVLEDHKGLVQLALVEMAEMEVERRVLMELQVLVVQMEVHSGLVRLLLLVVLLDLEILIVLLQLVTDYRVL